MKKKILFICQSLPTVVCGVGDHLYFVVKNLGNYSSLLHIKILTSNSEKIRPNLFSSMISEKFDKWSLFNFLLKIYKFRDFDIIHYQYPIKYPVPRSIFFRLTPISFFLKIFMSKSKIFLTIHEFYKLNFFLKILKLFEISCCDRVFVVTYIDESFLKKIFKNKIQFIPVGSNIPAFKNKSKEVTKPFKIVFFGFIDDSKGIENILDVISRLLISNQDVNLTLIGQFITDEYKRHIFSVIKRLRLNKNIAHIPYIPTEVLSKKLTNFDLAFLPFRDGVATNRSSAIACLYAKLPIMTTYKDIVTPKYFKHMENCILTKFNDRDTMYECIKILINDSVLYKKLQKGSYELTKKFDWKRTAEIMKAEYLKNG